MSEIVGVSHLLNTPASDARALDNSASFTIIKVDVKDVKMEGKTNFGGACYSLTDHDSHILRQIYATGAFER